MENPAILVRVYHPEINNRSISIAIHKIKTNIGGIEEERDISRSYVFTNHEAQIPFEYVKLLLEQRGPSFQIKGLVETDESLLSEAALKKREQALETLMHMKNSFGSENTCPYCNKEFRKGHPGKLGLVSHIRNKHKEQYEEWKKNKNST